MTPHPLKRFQAIRRAFGPATHVRALPSLLGLTGLVAEALGLETATGSGGAASSRIRDLGPVFGLGGLDGPENPACARGTYSPGSGGENPFRVKVEISSPSSPSSPKNKNNPLITNETKNLKAAVSQALFLSTKPVKPNGLNEETTGGAVVKQERNILSIRVEDQRQRHAEFLEAERQRMARVAAAAKLVTGAAVPEQCGGGIIPAPARGACVVVPHLMMVPNGEDARGQQKWDAAPTGYGHRASVRAADVFDRMGKAAADADRPAPFTPGQVAVARRYRALVERHNAGGVKCSDLIGRTGSSGRDFMDAYLAEGSEIEVIRRRIGTGASLTVRRVRPSARGGADRRTIPDRSLVDMVCLGDSTLTEVLRAHGWATFGDNRKALAQALSAALDRMIGYRGEKTS